VAETFERVGGVDPSPRLPLRDAVPHREPMRQIASTRAAPDLAMIRLDDQTEQPVLTHTDLGVSGIDVIDERVLAIPLVVVVVRLVHEGDAMEHLFGYL
jgi:hypothetical protein